MYAVEFQAIIENGVVHIPKEYKDLQEKREVRFFIMYDDSDKHKTNVENRKRGQVLGMKIENREKGVRYWE